MTIDIEKLIEEIDEDGSGEIEFDEFKALLQTDWLIDLLLNTLRDSFIDIDRLMLALK